MPGGDGPVWRALQQTTTKKSKKKSVVDTVAKLLCEAFLNCIVVLIANNTL